eukprot:GDKJ01036543.1.p1 GENE.GDKJ01036543.1~~GDKJ01036543.1.p1  ORF type:complete len:1054 (-),score=224.81 GDKJ01036543.1:163-3213(-)
MKHLFDLLFYLSKPKLERDPNDPSISGFRAYLKIKRGQENAIVDAIQLFANEFDCSFRVDLYIGSWAHCIPVFEYLDIHSSNCAAAGVVPYRVNPSSNRLEVLVGSEIRDDRQVIGFFQGKVNPALKPCHPALTAVREFWEESGMVIPKELMGEMADRIDPTVSIKDWGLTSRKGVWSKEVKKLLSGLGVDSSKFEGEISKNPACGECDDQTIISKENGERKKEDDSDCFVTQRLPFADHTPVLVMPLFSPLLLHPSHTRSARVILYLVRDDYILPNKYALKKYAANAHMLSEEDALKDDSSLKKEQVDVVDLFRRFKSNEEACEMDELLWVDLDALMVKYADSQNHDQLFSLGQFDMVEEKYLTMEFDENKDHISLKNVPKSIPIFFAEYLANPIFERARNVLYWTEISKGDPSKPVPSLGIYRSSRVEFSDAYLSHMSDMSQQQWLQKPFGWKYTNGISRHNVPTTFIRNRKHNLLQRVMQGEHLSSHFRSTLAKPFFPFIPVVKNGPQDEQQVSHEPQDAQGQSDLERGTEEKENQQHAATRRTRVEQIEEELKSIAATIAKLEESTLTFDFGQYCRHNPYVGPNIQISKLARTRSDLEDELEFERSRSQQSRHVVHNGETVKSENSETVYFTLKPFTPTPHFEIACPCGLPRFPKYSPSSYAPYYDHIAIANSRGDGYCQYKRLVLAAVGVGVLLEEDGEVGEWGGSWGRLVDKHTFHFDKDLDLKWMGKELVEQTQKRESEEKQQSWKRESNYERGDRNYFDAGQVEYRENSHRGGNNNMRDHDWQDQDRRERNERNYNNRSNQNNITYNHSQNRNNFNNNSNHYDEYQSHNWKHNNNPQNENSFRSNNNSQNHKNEYEESSENNSYKPSGQSNTSFADANPTCPQPLSSFTTRPAPDFLLPPPSLLNLPLPPPPCASYSPTGLAPEYSTQKNLMHVFASALETKDDELTIAAHVLEIKALRFAASTSVPVKRRLEEDDLTSEEANRVGATDGTNNEDELLRKKTKNANHD